MLKNKRINIVIVFLLIISDILETISQLCFKKSAITHTGINIKYFNDIFIFLKDTFLSPFLWLGILSIAGAFILWIIALSRIDLSVAIPIASLSYILVSLTSVIFLHEKISMLRWAGIMFILCGVMLVSLSSENRMNT